MASISLSPQQAPPPWTSTSTSKTYNDRYDCALGICNFNCPQWCTIPPPPPPLFINSGEFDDGDDSSSSSSSSRISPLMAALIAVLAAAFILLLYFTVISKLCRRRNRDRNRNRNSDSPFLDNSGPISARVDSLTHGPGLDDAFIRQITVFKYEKEDKLIDGTECSVCLNEFHDGENLRLMPNCEHAFHIPCIDTWLKTQSSCPLCRATMNPLPARSSSGPGSGSGGGNGSSNLEVAALRVERRVNDVVLGIREVENRVRVVEEVVGNGNLEGRETKIEVVNHNQNNQNQNNNNTR